MNLIILVAISADNLDVLNSDSRGGHEVGQGNYWVNQVKRKRIVSRNM